MRLHICSRTTRRFFLPETTPCGLFSRLLCCFFLPPPQAGAQTVDAPYASVDACASISQLEFNGTSANQSITQQVELGPRTTGSNGSAALRTMIHEQLRSWDVVNHTHTEDNFTFTNVVATYSSVAVNPFDS